MVQKTHSLNGSHKNDGDNDTSEENGKRAGNFVKDVSRANQTEGARTPSNAELELNGSLQLTEIHVYVGHVPCTQGQV